MVEGLILQHLSETHFAQTSTIPIMLLYLKEVEIGQEMFFVTKACLIRPRESCTNWQPSNFTSET